MNRTDDSTQLTHDPLRRRFLVTGTLSLGMAALPIAHSQDGQDRISRQAEAIHQEPTFAASRAVIYRTMTDARRFDRIMALSESVKSAQVGKRPAKINAHAGGAFALFGEFITGRFIELVPDQLIVQAWRVGNWSPGTYSVARFELVDDGGGTRILFDHTGFPVGAADHLAAGWHSNYWDPLREALKMHT